MLDTIERKNVDGLVKIWYEAAFLGEEGREIRRWIVEKIPVIASFHAIEHVVDPRDKNPFRTFVEVYDKVMLDRECPWLSPGKCLLYFIKQENWKGIVRAIERGARNWNDALLATTLCSTKEIGFQIFLSFWAKNNVIALDRLRKTNDASDLLLAAVRGNNLLIVKFLFEQGMSEYEEPTHVVGAAVRNNNREMIDFLLNKGYSVEAGLEVAAETGNWELIHFFMRKDPENYNFGLQGAALGGHLDLIEFFIANGADYKEAMDVGLLSAAQGGHISLIDYFLEKGADGITNAVKGAARGGHKEVLHYLLDMLSKREQQEAIQETITHLHSIRPLRQAMIDYLNSL